MIPAGAHAETWRKICQNGRFDLLANEDLPRKEGRIRAKAMLTFFSANIDFFQGKVSFFAKSEVIDSKMME